MSLNHLITRVILAVVILASDRAASTMSAKTENLITGVDRLLIEDNLIKDLDNMDLESERLKLVSEQSAASNYQESLCRLVRIVHLLKHPGCQSKAISSYACLGSCPSYVKTPLTLPPPPWSHPTLPRPKLPQTSTSKLWQLERSCSCCQQTGSQEATFTLDCPSLEPPFRKVKTHAPVDCLCRSCTDLGREDLRPQELVEALAKDGRVLNGITSQE